MYLWMSKHTPTDPFILSEILDKVGTDPIELLMSGINELEPGTLSDGVATAVQSAKDCLSERDRWVIDAVYIWGHSYSEIADMMGYSSKASAHGAVKSAQKKLKEILELDYRIIRMMERKVHMSNETWADAAWRHLRAMDRCANGGEFTPDIFDAHFRNMGACVKCLDTDKLADICWSAGCEAGRALVTMGVWDIETLQDTLCSKQHDYGHDNINAFGIIGVAVRLSDKIARYKNLLGKQNRVAGETIVDTLTDMVGYAVLARMLEDGTFQLDLVMEDPF